MLDPQLFAADLLAQGLQDTEFVIDAADLVTLARFVARDDGFAPGSWHNVVERDRLGTGEMGLGERDIHILLEQFQRLNDPSMDLVVGTELQMLQDDPQHAPVMLAVRPAHGLLHLVPTRRPAAFLLFSPLSLLLLPYHLTI